MNIYSLNMSRNKLPRTISSKPKIIFFKPQGVCLKHLEVVELQDDEFEALKLHDVDQLPQIEAAYSMNVSQPTFGRILNSAYQKISKALLEGKAIVIQYQKGSSREKTEHQKYIDYSHLMCDVCDRHCLVE